MFRKRKKPPVEIPTSSMADISFLLLLFFLVTTTIDVDTGIDLVLPPWIENAEQVAVKSDNIANLLVNEVGDVLLDEKIIGVPQIKGEIIARIKANPKLIISYKTVRDTPYKIYIDVMDQLKMAYTSLREEYAREKYGISLEEATEQQIQEIREAIPQRISLAEPAQAEQG
ncbi:MAG TPA: biopolymer transporter ExbD [Bacteroidota bacterium]|jgi:biopolymer transport protein ExbD|nr:biopolymer transporter ExbD [Bacteroidota bacterium]